MTFPRSRRHWLAVTTACAFFLAVPAALGGTLSGPGDGWQPPGTMRALVQRLETWLDSNSPYPRRAAPVSVQIVGAETAARLAGRPSRAGQRVRGYYDPETRTVYLVEPWSRHDTRDAGVLLHELVHHRQQTSGHWYCPGAQELPAYRLQQAWLAEHRLASRINWIAVVLEAGCAPRDIHPD